MKKLILLFLLLCVPSIGESADQPLTSTIEDQSGVEVTVYNNNLGLVKDKRKIAFPQGHAELRFMDVAAHIMPWTVSAKSINDPDRFSVLEQNYEYDLINNEKLMDKYVGKKVKLITWNQFKDRKETIEAELLSNNQGAIYRINDEIYLGHPGTVILPKLPEDLIAKPTLMWLVDNTSPKPHELEVSYLTQNISWRADYVVIVNPDDTKADLTGWVTLDNTSGTTYRNARLKLVAGEVNRTEEERDLMLPAAPKDAMMMKDAGFVEKAFFEYHIYDLQRPTTIKDKQTKQVQLLEASEASVHKELLVYGIKTYCTVQFVERVPKQPVNVYMVFKNSKENKLGMPLPAGVMRLYKKDTDGSAQFIGEDTIQHTPKDEEIRLKAGEAFDVVAERFQTDFKQLTTRLYETEWELTLRNHKDQEVTIGVIEPLLGNWKVMRNSHPYRKVDAFTIRFDVKIPKDGEAKVKYRVRVGI